MLTRHHHHASLALCFVLPAALVAGCVVTKEDTDNDVRQTTANSSSSSSSSSGAGGAGGAGGEGGSGGQGGEGGQSGCVETAGTNKTAAACEELNIAPAQGASRQCPGAPDQDPYGYRLCKGAFGVFSQGQSEDLLACLSEIGVQDACDFDKANLCTNAMYDNACVRPRAATTCAQIAEACGTDPLDTQRCTDDLNPFSDAGDALLVECMNSEANMMLSCQAAYDTCYTEVTSF